MGWRVEGSCKQCGECCKKLMRKPNMLTHPGGSMDASVWCKYLFEENGKWLCEIRQAYEGEDTEFIEMIPQLDREYYLEECKDYPDPEKPAHVPPLHKLLEGCGFRIV